MSATNLKITHLSIIDFGRQIKEARESRSISRRELSSLSGISHSYIAQLERGEIENTTLFTIISLSLVLESVSINLINKP